MKRQTKDDKWKDYAALCTKENEDALNTMRRVSQLHRKIVKRAIQRQAQYEKANQRR